MIDEIFEMIMKEARARSGKDLGLKLNTVFLEVSDKVISAQDMLRNAERRKNCHED